MSECVMLIAFAKISAGKRWGFSWPYIRRSAPPYHPSSTNDYNITKDKKLTKKCVPSPHWFSTQSLQY